MSKNTDFYIEKVCKDDVKNLLYTSFDKELKSKLKWEEIDWKS